MSWRRPFVARVFYEPSSDQWAMHILRVGLHRRPKKERQREKKRTGRRVVKWRATYLRWESAVTVADYATHHRPGRDGMWHAYGRRDGY